MLSNTKTEIVRDEIVNQRTIDLYIPWFRLQEIIKKEVMEILETQNGAKGNYKIKIEQEAEGNPSYPINKWFVRMVITLDLKD